MKESRVVPIKTAVAPAPASPTDAMMCAASSGVCVGESLLTRTIEQTRTLKDRPLILPAKGVADAEDFISDGMVQTELTGAIESVGKRPQSTFRSLC